MTHSRLATVLLAAPLLLGGLHAQSQLHKITLPDSGFVASAVGDYTDNRRQHVVMLHGDLAYLVFSPATHDSVTLMSSSWRVHDVATLETPAVDRADRLLGIGPDGLTFGQYGANNLFSWYVLSAGNWVDGAQLATFGSTTNAFAVGLSADRTQLGVGLVGRGIFGGDVWANQGAPVLDFVPLDLHGDGNMQVAVLTASELRILDAALAPQLVVPGNGGAIARLQAAGEGDRLAWVRPQGNGHELVLVSMTSVSTPLHLTLPLATGSTDVFPLVGIAAADADGDGRDDLAIAQNATAEVVVLYQQPTGEPFTIGTPLPASAGKVRAYESQAASLMSMPVFADCDGDRRADVLVPSGPIISPLVGDGGEGDDGRPSFPDGFALSSLPPFYLRVRFHIPEGTPQTSVQVVVWLENAPLNTERVPGPIGIESEPYSNTHHLLLRENGVLTALDQEVHVRLTDDLDAEFWERTVGTQLCQPHLWVEVRFVTPTQDDPEADATPFACCGLTLRNTDELLQEATYADQPFMDRLLRCEEGPVASDDPKPLRGRQLLGGIIPVLGLPRTRDATLPPNSGQSNPGNPAVVPIEQGG